MKNEKLIQKTKTIDKILKILEVLVLLAIAIITIGTIALAFIKTETAPDTLSIGSLQLTLKNASMIDAASLKTGTIFTFISGLSVAVLSYISIKTLRKIVAPMKQGRPFEKGIAKDIRKYGILVLVAGCLKAFAEFVGTILMNRALYFKNLFNMENISSINFQYDISFDFVILAAVIFIISIIFEYGEELQTESDETL